MQNKTFYKGFQTDSYSLTKGKEYTVKSLKLSCFSGTRSGYYFLIDDDKNQEIWVHSLSFEGEPICLVSDEKKKIYDERRRLTKRTNG